jgi:hypothetical protein
LESNQEPGAASFARLHGYIKSPEELEPDANRHRTTASLIYNMPLGHDANWSNSFIWGQNRDSGHGTTQSFLVESNYQRGRDTFYARFEHVEKQGHELMLDEIDHERIFPINAYTVGTCAISRTGEESMSASADSSRSTICRKGWIDIMETICRAHSRFSCASGHLS